MFDRGIVSISERGGILTVPGLVLDQVRPMLNPNGKILMAEDTGLAPHPHFPRFHRERIFKGAH
jgi:putative restriction endonuclease